MNLSTCKVYQYTPYAGNTPNQLIKSIVECSSCLKIEMTTFVQKSSKDKKTGWRFCSTCLHEYLDMPDNRT